MSRPLRSTVAFLGTAVAALGLASPAAVADAPAPASAVRIHSAAYGGCLTAEGSAYRDPRGTSRPWLVALQPCEDAPAYRQSWRYSPDTRQYQSVAEPYRCVERRGGLLVTSLCDADSAAQRFRVERVSGSGGGRVKVVAEADGRVWEQVARRGAWGEGVRDGRDGGSGAQRWWIGAV
ncbi:RICIN domain-containing protein [Streptomyces albireticuli]|nr:RICIN domain-containing protein [Streptomyces albireticuli]MCD9144207.1 RICIN domain-containing protein [Streptomyces albireticuli]MCD9162150.1 RICIN domain-containing protein [Streptomyces albireticuli]MCD9193844.1 RICIN domain-containing protein [Streptomyces albireticuli]